VYDRVELARTRAGGKKLGGAIAPAGFFF